ncbi:ABC transporter substrate-binding protein [Dictyobacter formicarum]|uniref:ABC transporter substrate-binding protein n=1 Tax=Dictyobacter formicarum TaxID=2778368 RepID=A0ABQ3VWC9_9CHLR|nr:sugar ABC transporter substrate-binding protein [Dictyobacter formicarum]GHO89934.1 ABC transporter substrate-binding protein [Dictyobacter formicarum]
MRDTLKIASAPLSRRRFLINSAMTAGVTIGAGALLDACDTSTTSNSSGGSATTLTVMYLNNEFLPAYITDFQKANPNIKLKFLTYDQARLNAMFAAGQPPDFIRTVGASEMPYWSSRGVAQDLSQYFAKSSVIKEDDLEPVNDVYRWDGKSQGQGARYGMAKDWSLDAMMWYNEKIFKQAGVSVPSSTDALSYDELLAIGKKLTVRKNGKIQIYGLDAEYGFFMQGHLLQMIAQQGGQLFSTDLSQADFSTPEARKAVKFYVDFAQAHVGPSPLDPDAAGGYNLFTAGRVGMIAFGYWYGGAIATQTNGIGSSSGMMPAPQMGSTRISTCMSGTGAWIPAASKNKDAAWKVMEYFMAGKPSHDRAQSGWGVPALKSLISEMPQGKPYQKEAFQALQHEMQYQKTLGFSPYITDDGFNAAFAKAIEPVMRGQSTLDQGIKQLNQSINKLLQQGKQQAGS